MKTRSKSPGALIFVQVLAVEKVPVAHHVMDNINHDIDCPLPMEQGV
jgi:hypothetical protein